MTSREYRYINGKGRKNKKNKAWCLEFVNLIYKKHLLNFPK